jgi:hypothetical protein
MPTLLERLAKLKGESAPAAVPTPPPTPAPVAAPKAVLAPAPKKLTLSERIRAMTAKEVPAPAPPAPVPTPSLPVERRVPPPSPEGLEEMRKKLASMTTESVKAMYEASKATPMVPAEKTILLEEVERRGLFKVAAPPKPAAPAKVPGTVDYEMLSKEGKLDREKFDTFMREWGLDLEREEHERAADWVWDYLKKNKALPSFEAIPTEEKNFIYRNYMGKLKERLGEELEKQVAIRGVKSADELVGALWTKYGRHWVRIPPTEFGMPEYPGGLSAGEWHDRFLSSVMKSPYNARPRRAQELYNEYGRFGRMPPLSEFPSMPKEILDAVAKGTEPSDAEAVLDFYKESNRPLTRLDLLVIFDNDEAKAAKVEKEMGDYTEERFLHETYRIIDELVATPQGREKLKSLVLTDNRRLFADIVGDKVKEFKESEPEYIDLAFTSLRDRLYAMLPAEERNEFVARMDGLPTDMRKELRVEMNKIRPDWLAIQAAGKNAGLINKWGILKGEMKDIDASDFFMRYPEVSKEEARALEEHLKFNDIRRLWEGNLPTEEQIKKVVPELVKKVGDYKSGENKAGLEKDLGLLERLDDLYMYHTGQHIVTRVDVGSILKGVDFVDAMQFAKDVYRPEWLAEPDYEAISKLIQEKNRIPTAADLFKLFGDQSKARAAAWLFRDYKVPPGIKLSDEVIRQIASFNGLGPEEAEAAVAAFRGTGEFPLSKVERAKAEADRERQRAVRRLVEIVGRAVPKAEKAKLEEIKALSAGQAVVLQRYTDYIGETERKVEELNRRMEGLEKQKRALAEKGTKQQREANEGEIVEAEEERKNLYAALSAARHERLAFVRTLPKVDYTRGQAEIDHEMYATRMVEVKGQDVPLTLEDIYKYWVGPVEAARKEFVAKNKREPESYELALLEPSVDKILAEEKEGKKVADKEKKVAAVVLMNYARGIGAYPFEYEMATLAKDLGVKDVPLFALPAQTSEARAGQFMEWLRYGLTRHEVESWQPHVQLAFIGDDWTSCDWEGEPKKVEDVTGQKVHIEACAIKKAKAAQAVALQFVEPRLLQPIIVEAVEGAAPTEELKKLVAENERLKKELKEKTDQLVEAMAIGAEAKSKLMTVADLEAKITAMEERTRAPAGGKRLILKRPATEEVEATRAQRDVARREVEALVGKEQFEKLEKELASKKKELEEVTRKVERERAAVRGVCFEQSQWDLVKASISERVAADVARLREIQERLGASRTAGMSVGKTAYDSEIAALRDEVEVLEGLTSYIREVEGREPGKFLCKAGE